jgi:hypothetical protein
MELIFKYNLQHCQYYGFHSRVSYSAKIPKDATALIRMPISVKLMDIPVTIARSSNLLPTSCK